MDPSAEIRHKLLHQLTAVRKQPIPDDQQRSGDVLRRRPRLITAFWKHAELSFE